MTSPRRYLSPLRAGLGLLGLVSLVGCSSGGLIPTPGASAAREAELERQIVELKKEATVGRIEVARLEREVARLKAELARTRPAASSGSTTVAERPVIVSEPAPAPVERQPEIEEIDLEDPPPVATPTTAGGPPPPPTGSVVAPSSVPVAASAEAQRLYDEAYTLFHQQDYPRAEEGFRRYVELYPETELADNALFWVGESRYARGDYTGALAAFSDTVERFPQGNKVGDALLKAGKCLEALNDEEQARATYEEVARRYPGSAASAQALERLEALRGG